MRRKGPAPNWGERTSEEVTSAYKLAEKIFNSAKDAQGYFDFLSAVENFQNDQRVRGIESDYSAESRKSNWTEMMRDLHDMNRQMQGRIRADMKDGGPVLDLYEAYSQSLLLEAPWDFEQYMLYCEIDRPPEEKFYQPRMKTLRPVVQAMQDLEDGELDEVFLSMPPRVGKTTLMDFFVTWEIGKHPDGSCLYSSMSDTVTKQFYLGLLEIVRDPYTYHWDRVFPNSPVVKVNAADQTVNCLRKTRYPSITCRSIEGTLNGACDCDNILIADDLCKGLEQAINKDVMVKLWARTQTDLLSRAKQGSKKLWIGTRWSLIDPIGCRVEMLKEESKLSHVRWREILLPALDEHDESNFNWKYGIGFDTQTFQGIRAGYERNNDMASWNAVYQQQPIEREGSLFASGDMRFYNGMLPKDKEPDRRFMAVDPAFGGSDFTAAPVCYQYEDTVYVVDVVYTDGDKRESIPALAKAVQKYKVSTMQIEANKMTEGYADELQAFMRQNNIYCTVLTKPAPNNVSKEQRIFDRAPEIRESFVFLEHGQRPKHYQQFMDNVFSFTIMKRNKHDDAPDSLAMAASMVFRYQNNFVHTFRRAF